MKRWLVRICVLLVLGAIVNVAVAWGLCLKCPLQPIHTMTVDGQGNWCTTTFNPRVGTRSSFIISTTDPIEPLPLDQLEKWSVASTLEPRFFEGNQGLYEQARGWPLLSLSWHAFTADALSTRLANGWALGPEPLESGALPLRPIWPGFAINTVFYAVIVWWGWLLVAGTFVSQRRRRRIRRGLCPKCAYDLRGSTGATACPECGSIVSS